MVNSPAHLNLFGPLQREEPQQNDEKQDKIDEEENSGEKEEEEEEEVEDEDETEIQRLIRISQHHLLKAGGGMPPPKRMPQSCSAHANLGMGLRRTKRNWTENDQKQLETSAEEDEEENEDEEEDSDEEIFAAHNSLLPLRKSKSAFAGFQSNFVKSTKPFACPVIVKRDEAQIIKQKDEDEFGQKEIAEMIDLRRGDVLEFRVDDVPKQCRINDEAKCSTSSSSSSLSSICPRESCWSAPACPNDSERELSSASSEEGDDLGGKFRQKQQRRRSGLRRKQTSWSAPSKLGADPHQMIEGEWKGREEMKMEGEMLEPWKRRRSVRIKDEIDNGMEEEECRQFPDAQKWEYKGRILEEENEEKVGKDGRMGEKDEENEDEQEEEMLIPEPTNMKCLEMDEQGDEAMSTGEEEDEEEGDEDGMGEDELNAKQQMKTSASSNNVHMRVFVQRNNPQMFHRRRHFPSSRSDSQLLWQRQNLSGNGSRAPPPPAPFPLDEREEEMMAESQRGISWRIGSAGMAHSRTYGGFMREEERGMAMNSEGVEEEELEIQRRLDELEKKMQMNQTTTMDDASTKNPSENAEMDGTAHFHSLNSGNAQTEGDGVQIFEGEIIKEEKSQRDEFAKKTLPFDGHRPHCLLNSNSNRQIHSPIRPNLLGSDELIPMADADDQSTPSNHSMAAGYYLPLPLGNRQKRQQSKLGANGTTNLDNSLSSSSYYSEEDEENGEGERRGFRRSRVGGKVLMQRSAAARLCRRGSPPLAQNELMSESEISDLEQQIASGRLIKSYAGTSTGEQLLDEEEEEKEEKEDGGMLEDEEEKHKEEDRLGLEGEAGELKENIEEEGENEEGDEENVEEKEEDEENQLEIEEKENGEEELKAKNKDEEAPFEGEESVQDEKQREEIKMDKEEIKKRNKKSDYEEEEKGIKEEMCQQQMFNSSSMPSIAGANSATNLEGRQQQRLNSYWGPAHVRADFWQSEYPIGEEEERELGAHPNGHQIDYPTMMHRSLTVQSECFEGERPRRRRMLPLRPDQIEQLRRQSASASLTAPPLPQTHHQPQSICAEEYHHQLNSPHQHLAPISPDQFSPSHCLQSLSHSFGQQKRRQLPKTPPSPKEAEKDPLDKIDIATATKEYLLSVLHQQNQKQQRPMELNAVDREQDGENFEEYSHAAANPPVLPSPSVIQRPILPLLPLHQPQKFGHQSGALDEQQYKLSYGMDQSALKLAARRKPLSIEGSFYEDIDGLNGNLTGAFYSAREQQQRGGWADGGDDLYTPDDEGGERRRISGYNLADGAKSSSGISSCCTTSSRSNEAADADFQQLLMRRQQKGAGNGAGKMAAQSSAADDPHAPTHRVQCPFMPRHADELRLERGDALHLIEKFDDHWCSALNLRTGQRGIFPEAHIVEIDLVDEICRSVLPEMNHQQGKERDTFYLTMLASIEVAHHKGNDVLVQGINKVCSMYQRKEEILVPQTVLMEISFRGIHVIDKRKKDIFRCPTFDFFYSLQNISFCGAHPQELRYFGFITKHPLLPRFACHVFMSNESTQPIVEAIGRAFKRSYDEYMAFAHPTEDIFLE